MELIDTTVLVAAMIEAEPHHETCNSLLDREGIGMYAHGLSEAFNPLTGGRRSFRLAAGLVQDLLTRDYGPCLSLTTLTPWETLGAMGESQPRGVRGAAIFDFLHLVAA